MNVTIATKKPEAANEDGQVVWICFQLGRMERGTDRPRPGCEGKPKEHSRCGWYELTASPMLGS